MLNTNNQSESNFLFSVLITNYNREYLIARALDSVKQQKYQVYQIVIVDDGSTDNSCGVIQKWIEANPDIPTTFLKLAQNQGKPSAWNQALLHLNGTYTVPLDSDDELLPEALTIFAEHWEKIQTDAGFVAVEGLAYLNNSKQLSTAPFPQNPFTSNWLALAFKHRLWGGDCRRAYKTSILKQYPFTIHPNETDTMDTLITYRMSHNYQVYFINQPVQIIHQQTNSLSTQGQARRIKSPNNFRQSCLELITFHQHYLTPREYIKTYFRYILFSLHANIPITQQIHQAQHLSIYIFLFPIAIIKYLYETIKYK